MRGWEGGYEGVCVIEYWCKKGGEVSNPIPRSILFLFLIASIVSSLATV